MALICAFCGEPTNGEDYSIHRDGFGVGPEVPLCRTCGASEFPTCADIWSKIAQPADGECAFKPITKSKASRFKNALKKSVAALVESKCRHVEVHE